MIISAQSENGMRNVDSRVRGSLYRYYDMPSSRLVSNLEPDKSPKRCIAAGATLTGWAANESIVQGIARVKSSTLCAYYQNLVVYSLLVIKNLTNPY